MDWALKAAKKKFKNQAGGSRSIVESLNDFNGVILKGHRDAEDIFYRSNDWINMEMERLGFPRDDGTKVAPVSPEKSLLNDDEPEEEKSAIHHGATEYKSDISQNQSGYSSNTKLQAQEKVQQHNQEQEQEQEQEQKQAQEREQEQEQKNEREQARETGLQLNRKKKHQQLQNQERIVEEKQLKAHGDETFASRERDPGTCYVTDEQPGDNKELPQPDVQDNNNTNFNQRLFVQPAITPKSLLGDDTGRIQVNSSIKKSTESSAAKSSPWQVQRDIKDSTTTGEIKLSMTKDNWIMSQEIDQNNQASELAIDEKIHHDSVIKSIRDRSQRRSNMFVPLPSKDPLIVQPTPSHNRKRAYVSGTHQHNQSKKLDTTAVHIPLVTTQPKPKSPRYEGNVFERLSNNLTESFERKAAERRATSPIRNKRNTTSPSRSQRPGASIHGSPTSRKNASGSSHTDKIHHTLKNIFDSRIPQLPKKNTTVQPLKRRVSNLIDRTKVQERKSLIPRIQKATPIKPIHGNTVTETNENKHIHGGESIALMQSIPTRRESMLAQKTTFTSPNSLEQKTNAHDRLTKFQLIPNSTSSKQEKDVLKQKLNKRLSEVMRNQQEQQMRKKFEIQQRRISQADEDSKRRTKILLDHNNSTLPTLSKATSTNSVLYDINTVDYREMIGLPQNGEEFNGDVTLPEIASDDEGDNPETARTLASWAEAVKLKQQLLSQQDWDIEKILGPIPVLHIDEIFQTTTSRLQKLKKR